MADVKLDYSASEINNALGVAKSIEYGHQLCVSDGKETSISSSRSMTKSHGKNAKVFLQVRIERTSGPDIYFSVIPVLTELDPVNGTFSFRILSCTNDITETVYLPKGNIYVDYLIVG